MNKGCSYVNLDIHLVYIISVFVRYLYANELFIFTASNKYSYVKHTGIVLEIKSLETTIIIILLLLFQ